MERVAGYRLTIHVKSAQPRPVSEGLPFLGFVIFPTHRRLKRRKGIHYRRKLLKLVERYADGKITLAQVNASVQGWVNHARYGNTYGLRRAILRQITLSPPLNPPQGGEAVLASGRPPWRGELEGGERHP